MPTTAIRKVRFGYGNQNWVLPVPAACPLCHEVVVIEGCGYFIQTADRVEAAFKCPNPTCERVFVCIFSGASSSTELTFVRVYPTEISTPEVPEVVRKLSPDFSNIYQEAKQAKSWGLSHICGPGYRKAFEFLIKDYAKTLVAEEGQKRTVETSFAGKVVADYIGDTRIQAVAKRALWLGNDETHYLRRWTDHDVEDLIALIELTMHWIEIDELSRRYQSELNEGGPLGG